MHWLQLFCIAMGVADNTNNNNKRLKSNMFVKKKKVVLKIKLGNGRLKLYLLENSSS